MKRGTSSLGPIALALGVVTILPLIVILLYLFVPSARPFLPTSFPIPAVIGFCVTGISAILIASKERSPIAHIGAALAGIGLLFVALLIIALIAFTRA